jgi:hypothetical protein
VFRVLLTGIHMMRTGEVNANLVACNQEARLPWVDELIDRKMTGGEQGALSGEDVALYEREYLRLREQLAAEAERSTLPEAPTAGEGIRDLLRRIRRATPITT